LLGTETVKLFICNSRYATHTGQTFPEILTKFLKMQISFFFCTGGSDQIFLKSGNFLKCGISASHPRGTSHV